MARSNTWLRGLVVLPLIFGCASRSPEPGPAPAVARPSQIESAGAPSPDLAYLALQVDSLRRLDPATQARMAVATGNLRLLGVGGHSFGFPGLNRDSTRAYSRSYDWVLLPYTGGMSVIINGDSTHIVWQEVAVAYAAVYNQTVVALVPRGD